MLKIILKNGAYLSFLNFFKIISVFVISYTITNFSDVKTLGKFTYLVSIIMLYSHPLRQGVILYLTKEINLSKENIGIILSDVLAIFVLVIPFVNLLFFLTTYYNDIPLSIIIKFLIIITILILKSLFTGFLTGIDKILFAKIPELLVYPIAFIVFIYNFKNTLDLNSVVDGFFFANIIQFIISLILFNLYYNFKSKLILKLKINTFKKILPFSISTLLESLKSNIIHIITGHLGLFELNGQFKIIQDIFKAPLLIKSSINTVFSPKISKLIDNKVSFQNLIAKLNFLILSFVTIFLISVISFDDTILNFFTINNIETKYAMYIFVFSEIILTTSFTGSIILLMTGNAITLIYVRAISIIILIISIYFSIDLGIIGVGLSMLLHTFSMSLLLIFFNKKINNINVFFFQNPFSFLVEKQ